MPTPEQIEANCPRRPHQARHLALVALLQAVDNMPDLTDEPERRVEQAGDVPPYQVEGGTLNPTQQWGNGDESGGRHSGLLRVYL